MHSRESTKQRGTPMVSERQQTALNREIALGAVRSQSRRIGIDPRTLTADDAWGILDDLNGAEPELQASRWYRSSTIAQRTLFFREWKRWQKQAQSSGFPTIVGKLGTGSSQCYEVGCDHLPEMISGTQLEIRDPN